MKTIEEKELQIIKRFYSYGSFCYIHLVSFDGKVYCYKDFIRKYPIEIIDNIGALTEISFDEEFLVPKYMITYNGKVTGYISLYNEKNKGLYTKNTDEELYNADLTYERKIAILKDAKNKIQKLHNKYEIIHGDLDVQNLLYDENYNVSIIDFDSVLKFNQQVQSTITLSQVMYNYVDSYLDYFKYDYKADIYRFNLTTLKILNNIACDEELFYLIDQNQIAGNNDVKKLSKELLLRPQNIKKEYSNEYIIDYV